MSTVPVLAPVVPSAVRGYRNDYVSVSPAAVEQLLAPLRLPAPTAPQAPAVAVLAPVVPAVAVRAQIATRSQVLRMLPTAASCQTGAVQNASLQSWPRKLSDSTPGPGAALRRHCAARRRTMLRTGARNCELSGGARQISRHMVAARGTSTLTHSRNGCARGILSPYSARALRCCVHSRDTNHKGLEQALSPYDSRDFQALLAGMRALLSFSAHINP